MPNAMPVTALPMSAAATALSGTSAGTGVAARTAAAIAHPSTSPMDERLRSSLRWVPSARSRWPRSSGKSQISVADYAIAMLDEAEQGAHRRQRFTVGY